MAIKEVIKQSAVPVEETEEVSVNPDELFEGLDAFSDD